VTAADFTLAGYGALLDELRARGYRSVDFADVRADAPQLILRHDIDLEPAFALPVAEAERARSMSAWYFFLVRSPLYAIAAPESVRVLKELGALGHRVGLHFDAALFLDDPAILDREARWECEVLERLAGTPVEMVSFHRPRPALLGRDGRIGGRDHAYRPRYFDRIGYCSDSRGAWRHGHPLDHPAVAAGRALQLLTHPIWWVTDSRGDPNAALAAFERSRTAALRTAIAETVTGYSASDGRILEEGNG
jgi:hypothetical protein